MIVRHRLTDCEFLTLFSRKKVLAMSEQPKPYYINKNISEAEADVPIFENLVNQVGRWSLLNFGFNKTDCLDCSPAGVPELGSLASLMGMMEELGELFTAILDYDCQLVHPNHKADALDAVSDFAIYLCDYSTREKVPIWDFFLMDEATFDWFNESFYRKSRNPRCVLVSLLGRLFHITLKRHQGIRGYHDFDKFHGEQIEICQKIIPCLAFMSDRLFGRTILSITQETWNKIVSKRDWKKDPETAVG